MTVLLQRCLRLACLLTVVLSAGAATAAPRTPFPRFTGERVIVAGVAQRYGHLPGRIAVIEQRSKQTYYVVVVASSGSGTWATRNYTDALYRAWSSQRAFGSYDVQRAVLIVLAERNRQLAVRAGDTLQARYGLRGQAVDRRFVRPHFIPHAKRGDHATGLLRLIEALDKHVAGIDGKAAQREKVQAARREESRAKAQGLLKETDAAATTAERLLAAKQAAGYDVAALATGLAQARRNMTAAHGALAGDPEQALFDAGIAMRLLHDVRDGVEAIDRARAALETRLPAAGAALRALAADVGDAHAEGHAVGGLRGSLDDLEAGLEQAEAAAAGDPPGALEAVESLLGRVPDVRARLAALPGEHAAWRTALGAAEADAARTRASLEEADEVLGADAVASDRARLAALEAELEALRGGAPDSYAPAQRELARIGAEARGLREGVSARVEDRRFWTERVPLYAACALAGLLALVLLVRFLIRTARMGAVTRALAARRGLAESVRARVDAASERHRLLLLSNPDFTVTLKGATRTLYDETLDAVAAERRRWRKAEDAWSEAEETAARQGWFGWKHVGEAAALLAAAPVPSGGSEAAAAIEAPVALLEGAHALARAEHEALGQDLAAVGAALEEVDAASLSRAPYEHLVAGLTGLHEEGGKRLRADPLGVRERCEDARRESAALVARTQRVVAECARARAVEQEHDATARDTAARRTEGFTFAEEGFDPDAHLARARDRRERGLALLDAGEPEGAAAAIDAARAAVQEARARLGRQVEGKLLADEQLPLLRAEATRIAAKAEATRPQLAELARAFAETSYEEVADGVELALETAREGDKHLDEAAAAADAAVQHYGRAADRIEQTRDALALAEAGLDAVPARLAELTELRERSRRALGASAATARKLGAWLREETRDRRTANLRFTRAEERLRQAQQDADAERADWPAIAALLTGADTLLAEAQARAQEDIALANEARREIEGAANAIEQADGGYGHGVYADVSEARAHLDAADAAYREQRYEDAVTLSDDAEREAERAAAHAESRARRKREAERRRRMESSRSSTGMGIFGSGSSIGGSSSGSSFGGSSFGGSSFGGSSGTSQSSWGSSGTSQSSW